MNCGAYGGKRSRSLQHLTYYQVTLVDTNRRVRGSNGPVTAFHMQVVAGRLKIGLLGSGLGWLGWVRFGLTENCRSRTRFPRMITVFLPPRNYTAVPINVYIILSLTVVQFQSTYTVLYYLYRWRGLDVLDRQCCTNFTCDVVEETRILHYES